MKVVLGHYPAYSSGKHAILETSTLHQMRKILEPIFKRYGVDVYLAGHEHHYERSKPLQGVHHIVSGAAGRLHDEVLEEAPHPREVLAKRFHFMAFEIMPNGLAFKAIDKDGLVFDQGFIHRHDTKQAKPLMAVQLFIWRMLQAFLDFTRQLVRWLEALLGQRKTGVSFSGAQ
jgi:hypothetical protein